MKTTIRSLIACLLFAALIFAPTARAVDPVQEGQKALNGNGVFTYIWTLIGTAPVGAGAPTSGQQAAFLAAVGLPPSVPFTTAALNSAWMYNGTAFAPSSATLTFLNASAAASPQTISSTSRTYVTGSAIGPFTAGQLKVGTVIRWHINITKTAAGTAAAVFDVAFGTAGTTADTAEVSFTKIAGTAAADTAEFDLEAQVQSVNTSTGVVVGTFRMVHNLAATGFSTLPAAALFAASSGFNNMTPTYAGICITAGASDAWTINQVSCEAINL